MSILPIYIATPRMGIRFINPIENWCTYGTQLNAVAVECIFQVGESFTTVKARAKQQEASITFHLVALFLAREKFRDIQGTHDLIRRSMISKAKKLMKLICRRSLESLEGTGLGDGLLCDMGASARGQTWSEGLIRGHLRAHHHQTWLKGEGI